MRLRPLLLGALICAVTACTGLQAPVVFDDHTYKLLVDNARFQRARDMLDRADPLVVSHEQRKLYREYLDLALRAYELETLQTAASLEQEGHWFEAEKVYRGAREALSRSAALEGGYREFDQHRSAYVDQLRKALRLHRARLLPVEIELTQQIAAVFPEDYALENRLDKLRFEAGELVAFMTPLAEQAFAQGQLEQARSYDVLILELGDSPVSEERIKAVRKRLGQVERQRALGEEQAKKRKRDGLWGNYDRAVREGDFARARQMLSEIDGLGFSGPVATQERSRLDGLIFARSTSLIDEGKRQYTRGQLDEALRHWREALQLVPDDQELLARIRRAETFQANYQRLSR